MRVTQGPSPRSIACACCEGSGRAWSRGGRAPPAAEPVARENAIGTHTLDGQPCRLSVALLVVCVRRSVVCVSVYSLRVALTLRAAACVMCVAD